MALHDHTDFEYDRPSWRDAYQELDLIEFLHTLAATMNEQHAYSVAQSLIVCAQYIEGRRHGQPAAHAEFLRDFARSLTDKDGLSAYLVCDRLLAAAECIEELGLERVSAA